MALPLFIPVYRPDHSFELFSEESRGYGLSAVMINSFLLFRSAELKKEFEQGRTLREHIGGFDGMLCTDSGAFQQLGGRKVDLDPLAIVKFQNIIKTDIAAPLDLITPPDTSFDETRLRMIITQHRIKEALEVSDYADLAGIQQGGGFYSLRQKHIRQLADIGVAYYGIGSMVPFFNKDHDLAFTCSVINDARTVIGGDAPMHVYGAGDPLEIAFMYLAGANVFDSSSYAHYAKMGYYMTPFGAVNRRAGCEKLDYYCRCHICAKHDPADIFSGESGENLRKQHNLYLLLETVRTLRERSENGGIEAHVSAIFDKHTKNTELFPGSMLARSWEKYLKGEKSDSGFAIEQSPPVTVSVRYTGEGAGETKNGALTEVEEALLGALADEGAGSYKMERGAIMQLLRAELLLPKNSAFRERVNDAGALKDVMRLSEYRAFRKNIRGSMYNKLRRYRPSGSTANELLAELIDCDDDEIDAAADRLLESHVSARERLPVRDAFTDDLRGCIEPGSVVIDIGCGLTPLLFPAEFYADMSCYIAVDKDADATEAVRVYAKRRGVGNLKAFTWDIGDGLTALYSLTGVSHYDAALMLKLIPVVTRADRAGNDSRAIQILGGFPATKILATVSRESMTKNKSIERRELAVLRQFIQTYGLVAGSGFSCGNETGFCLKKI